MGLKGIEFFQRLKTNFYSKFLNFQKKRYYINKRKFPCLVCTQIIKK